MRPGHGGQQNKQHSSLKLNEIVQMRLLVGFRIFWFVASKVMHFFMLLEREKTKKAKSN